MFAFFRIFPWRIKMRKFYSLLFAAIIAAVVLTDSWSQKKSVKIIVGATPVPHAEILTRARPLLAKKGIDLEIRVFTDYVIPNLALGDKSLDANYFQHVAYLENFSKQKNLPLVSAGAVHYEPLGLYSKKIKRITDIKNGDKIAVPNDVTNEARSLILLQNHGLISLKDPTNLNSTKGDIRAYRVKIEIVELEAAQITRALQSVTAAVINGNYAIDAKLNPLTDALIIEKKDSVAAKRYANVVAVRKGDENRKEIRELVKALRSPEIRRFIKEKYKGAVVALE
jgi:D-methionine transport system substrate-binding protein